MLRFILGYSKHSPIIAKSQKIRMSCESTLIMNLYNNALANLPFTQSEKILINNTLIGLLEYNNFKLKLNNKGIPFYFVSNFEFRDRFIEYMNNDRNGKAFIRRNIQYFGDINNILDSQEVSSELVNHLIEFTKLNMPNVLIACHKIKHLSDMCLFKNRSNDLNRSVIVHIGPPNSGKTHDAFIRLSQSKTGIYCSPLRVLAWEMQRKLQNNNIACDLLTGQERCLLDASHLSCTVEMTPFDKVYDCAIIDEMQMANDATRGYAWTNAFLNLKAKEMHLCGNESCLLIAKRLTNMCNDKLEIIKHKRKDKLIVMDNVVSFQDLEPGDCIICFSRQEVYQLRNKIENISFKWKSDDSLTTSIVYGTLPPKIRCSEIDKFNNNLTKILIASDAVGMGVNIRIKRIIFYKMCKFDGNVKRLLNSSEVQQIAGRAGRFNMGCGNGKVSCMDQRDIKYLKKMMDEIQDPIDKATIAPYPNIVQSFNSSLREATGNSTLVDAIQLLSSMAKIPDAFQLCDFGSMIKIAKSLIGIKLPDDILVEYLFVPIGSESLQILILRAFAISHSLFGTVKLGNILNEDLFNNELSNNNRVKCLEILHQILDTYIWLSYKFQDVYIDLEYAHSLEKRVTDLLSIELEKKWESDVDSHDDKLSLFEDVDPKLTKYLLRAEYQN